jgi:hyaluronan synthase
MDPQRHPISFGRSRRRLNPLLGGLATALRCRGKRPWSGRFVLRPGVAAVPRWEVAFAAACSSAPVYSFAADLHDLVEAGALSAFLVFFCYVWLLWLAKALLAKLHRPANDRLGIAARLRTTVIAPVYAEDPELFREVLESVQANRPSELIAVVDGGDPLLAAIARDLADDVILIPKTGKRGAIAAGLRASDPTTDVVVVLDSDTVWERGMLAELMKPFADPGVAGVTPRQAIFDRERNCVRRLADWIEDLRYSLTVPAQSLAGQVGCLAGRTIAYRRDAFEQATEVLVSQRVFGLEMTIGDDRVLTSAILRGGGRTVYQPTAIVRTDAPNRWPDFFRQQLRWGRSSQRETLLSLPWLWRRPFTLICFLSDIVIPFALYGLFVYAGARAARGVGTDNGPLLLELGLAYLGMIGSIGLRQLPHLRRYPGDARYLPAFVLVVTFVLAPLRIIAFATMCHTSWGTRPEASPWRENATNREMSSVAA